MSVRDTLAWIVDVGVAWGGWGWEQAGSRVVELVLAAGWTLTRAAGVTVETGHHGLKFSFGRVVRVVEPGFHPLVPGLQAIREVPTRARTVDLDAQRVVTADGLVFDVDATVTWRIVDVARALVEVDDLDRALADALAVVVFELVRRSHSDALRDGGALDARLAEGLDARVAVWGLTVEGAGFSTFTPTAPTQRVTQLGRVVASRRQEVARLVAQGMPARRALGVLGAHGRFVTRGRRLQRAEALVRWRSVMVEHLLDLEDDVQRARVAAVVPSARAPVTPLDLPPSDDARIAAWERRWLALPR